MHRHPSPRHRAGISAIVAALVLPLPVRATPEVEWIALRQPTATFSQTESGDYAIRHAVDGRIGNVLGWAVSPASYSTSLTAQTAVFETAEDIGFANGTLLTFVLHQSHAIDQVAAYGRHNLGRLRLSVTRDPRDSFADGLPSGGDVTANWIVLDPVSLISAGGTVLRELPDQSILAGGPNPSADIYTVTAHTSLTGITGIRLEVLEDPSLPHQGPGRRGENGNFVLTEFQVGASPVEIPSQFFVRSAAEICWLSAAGRRYQVQFATSPDSSEWFSLGEPVDGTGNVVCVYDSTRSREKRFYRFIELP